METEKLNPEVKEKWLKALRSGEYKQSVEYLKSESGYCCIGVLCDLHSKETGTKWRDHHIEMDDETGEERCISTYLGTTAFAPIVVSEWAGIDLNTVELLHKWEWNRLMGLNDSRKLTFPEIADLIEKQL